MRHCRCRFTNWRGLRAALGLSQDEMCTQFLFISRQTLWRLEDPGKHHCHDRATLFILRAQLDRTEVRSMLDDAGFPHPFKDEVDEEARRLLELIEKKRGRCRSCGRPFGRERSAGLGYFGYCRECAEERIRLLDKRRTRAG